MTIMGMHPPHPPGISSHAFSHEIGFSNTFTLFTCAVFGFSKNNLQS